MQENLPRQTVARGELVKINLDGCKACGNVYVSPLNSPTLQVPMGWYDLADLPQGPTGPLDIVIRVRGRRWGGILGQRICPDCKANGIK